MLLIDDLLLSPVKGILWIFREIHDRAQEEIAQEPDRLAQQLRTLYMELETGAISEAEFERQEKILLDRLDAIREQGETGEDESAEGEESDEEEADQEEEAGESEMPVGGGSHAERE